MADFNSLISSGDLRANRLKVHHGSIYSLRYQPGFDTLFILIIQPEHDTIVYYVDDHVGLICEDETFEIVGLQIEAFK
jgi:hypothetical protein